jgi:hypothetical protein
MWSTFYACHQVSQKAGRLGIGDLTIALNPALEQRYGMFHDSDIR